MESEVDLSAGKYNLMIEQGAKFGVQFTWQDKDGNPIDLSLWTGQIQFRESKDDTSILYDSDTAGDIVMGGVAGTVDFNLPTLTTTEFTFDDCLYDLELTDPDGEITRLVEGRVSLSKEVTKA